MSSAHQEATSSMSAPQAKSSISLDLSRFRVLLIGNANAGKTSILRHICNIGLENGREVEAEVVPSLSRGEHDINTEIVISGDHGFVFHDSRGCEAGSEDELKTIMDFIADRARRSELKERLHAIWYCLPTTNDRPPTTIGGVMQFFKNDTENVPVIAILTKVDALEQSVAKNIFYDLLNEERWKENLMGAKKEAMSRARPRVKEELKRDYDDRLKSVSHPPRSIIRLRNMDKDGYSFDCNKLIAETANALDEERMMLLFISVFRSNVKAFIKDAIEHAIIPHAREASEAGSFSHERHESLFTNIMHCFPYTSLDLQDDVDNVSRNSASAGIQILPNDDDVVLRLRRRRRRVLLLHDLLDVRRRREVVSTPPSLEDMTLLLPSVANFYSSHCEVIAIGAAMVSVLHGALFLLDGSEPWPHYQAALKAFKANPIADKLLADMERLKNVQASDISDEIVLNLIMANRFSSSE